MRLRTRAILFYLVLLLFARSAAADPAPSVAEAADAVLAAVQRGERKSLQVLAAADRPDPWLVAVSLLARGEEEALEGTCLHGNPNVLTRDLGTSQLAQGPSAQTCLVQVEKWLGKVPSHTAFEAPDIGTAVSSDQNRDPRR